MADPYAGLGTPEAPEAADLYAGIGKPAPPPKKSQALGFATGFMRPLDNAALALETGLEAVGIPAKRLGPVQDAIDSRSAALADYERKGVVPGRIGDFAGSLLATLPVGALRGGAIAQGALAGALNVEDRTPGGVAAGAGLGAVGGKLGDMAFGALANKMAGATRPDIKALTAAGIKPTPGQFFGGKYLAREDKLMSQPVIGPKIADARTAGIDQFNRALVNKALAPIKTKLPKGVQTGFEANAFAQKAVSDAYGRVVPKMAVKPDQPFSNEIQTLIASAQSLPKDAQRQLQATINRMGLVKQGGLAGKELQNVRSELGRMSSSYSGSGNAWERELGQFLAGARDHLDDLISRQNPTLKPEFEAANKAFRGQLVVDRAARQADNGVFSVGQAKQAIIAADPTRRKTATAAGEAYLQPFVNAARNVLPSKTPDSGTAGRLMEGRLVPALRGAASSAGYEIDRLMAELASRAPQGLVSAAGAARRPAGLFGSTAPAAALRDQRR